MALNTANTVELSDEQVVKTLVQPLEQQSLFLSAGPRIFDSAQPLRIPKLSGAIADPGFTGEGEVIPERDIDFDEVSLLPSTLASVKVLTKFSNELLRSSVVSLDSAIQARLVRDVASRIDTQFFGDSGDGVTTPQGMFAWSGTQNVDVAGALTFDHLLDAWSLALSAHVNTDALVWVMTPREFIGLRRSTDANSHYFLQPDVSKRAASTLFGAPILLTDRIPDNMADEPDTGRAALVDFSTIAVARDLSPSVTILKELFAATDESAIRTIARYDVAPLLPEGVVTLTGIAV